jgi:starch synthase
MTKQGHEVRVIMPKFGIINERTNRIHEVQRLYGINVGVGDDNISLIVKVAPIKQGKIQVYFIDNEELFEGKRVFHDEAGKFYAQNDSRIAFMCKSAWVILKNLGWSPDIIHCVGWPWSLVPLYGKRFYNNTSLFQDIKFVYTYGPTHFTEDLGPNMAKKALIRNLTEQDLAPIYPEAKFEGFAAIANEYSDKVTYSFNETDSLALDTIKKMGATHVPVDDNICENYLNIYEELTDGDDDSLEKLFDI